MTKRIFGAMPIMAFLILFATPDTKAQQGINSLEDCNRLSNVRPAPSALSPMERCQCEFDSSYCVQSQSETDTSSSGSSNTCDNNHVPFDGGCKSCWDTAGMIASGGSTAATAIAALYRIPGLLSILAGTFAVVRITVYGLCRLYY